MRTARRPRQTRRSLRSRRRTARMSGGARSAMSVISTISAEALRGVDINATKASGPAEATRSYARQTKESFYDLKVRLLDEKDISKKIEYIMHGKADEILPAYDKMVAKTQTRLAEYIHKLSAELAAEHNPKVRAKLEDNIFSVLVAAQATRDKLKAERLRLKAAVKDMRADPKLQKQAASVLTTGVKTAIAVFGVAAISYAGYHYGSKILKNINAAEKPASASGRPAKADMALSESREHLQDIRSSAGKGFVGVLLHPTKTARAVMNVAADNYKTITSDASVEAAVNAAYEHFPKNIQANIVKEMGNIAKKGAEDTNEAFNKAKSTYSWAKESLTEYTKTPEQPKPKRSLFGLGPAIPQEAALSQWETDKKVISERVAAAKKSVIGSLNAAADSASPPTEVVENTPIVAPIVAEPPKRKQGIQEIAIEQEALQEQRNLIEHIKKYGHDPITRVVNWFQDDIAAAHERLKKRDADNARQAEENRRYIQENKIINTVESRKADREAEARAKVDAEAREADALAKAREAKARKADARAKAREADARADARAKAREDGLNWGDGLKDW